MNTNRPARRSAAATAPRQPRRRHWLKLSAELASRLDALCQRHPEKNRSQLVEDLLNWALIELGRLEPTARSAAVTAPTTTLAAIYLPTGPFAEFHGLEFKHHLATERRLDPLEKQAHPPADERSLGGDD